MLTRDGSALVQFVSQSVTIPLSALTYAFGPIMYPFTETVSIWNIASICVILFGLVVYAFGDPDVIDKRKRDKTDDMLDPFIPVPGSGYIIDTREIT